MLLSGVGAKDMYSRQGAKNARKARKAISLFGKASDGHWYDTSKPAFRFFVGHPFSFLGVLGALARAHWYAERTAQAWSAASSTIHDMIRMAKEQNGRANV